MTVVSTLADSYLHLSAQTARGDADLAASRKKAKYSDLPSSYAFQSLAFETLGPLNASNFIISPGSEHLWEKIIRALARILSRPVAAQGRRWQGCMRDMDVTVRAVTLHRTAPITNEVLHEHVRDRLARKSNPIKSNPIQSNPISVASIKQRLDRTNNNYGHYTAQEATAFGHICRMPDDRLVKMLLLGSVDTEEEYRSNIKELTELTLLCSTVTRSCSMEQDKWQE